MANLPTTGAHDGESVRVWPAFRIWGQQRRQWGPETQRYYHARIAQADRWLSKHRGADIEHAAVADIQAWLDSCPANPKTRNTYLAALIAFYDWYVTAGMRRTNPARDLDRLRERPSEPRAPHPDDINAILDVADRTGGPGWVGSYLMAYAGLRIAETCSVQWADLAHGWVDVTGKGQRTRTLPVHPQLRTVLNAWQAQTGSASWVLPSSRRHGERMHTSTLRRHIQDIAAEAGFGEFVPHLFRHGAATRMLECGADVRTVQQFLGHSSLATTSRYLRVRPVRLAAAVEALAYS